MNNKTFLFDLNGTMINDMNFHTLAWLELLHVELGFNCTPEQIKKEMYGKNQEMLVRVLGKEKLSDAEINKLSMEKEKRYQKEYLPYLALLPGLKDLLERAHQKGICMAIGSATTALNINFVLDSLNIRHFFQAIISAEDVEKSKPDPETFIRAAELLQTDPENCIVFEDAPKGAEAAYNAGMNCIVLTTTHQPCDFTGLQNVIHFAPDFLDDYFIDFFLNL